MTDREKGELAPRLLAIYVQIFGFQEGRNKWEAERPIDDIRRFIQHLNHVPGHMQLPIDHTYPLAKEGVSLNARQIVNGLGIYRTNGGRLAFITEIAAAAESEEVSCVGYVLVFDQRAVATEWHRWTLNGRCRSGNDLEFQLVEQV